MGDKKGKKKLHVRKERLKELGSERLRGVVGGGRTEDSYCRNTNCFTTSIAVE